MNISKENIDDLNAVVTVKLDEGDYQDRVEGILKDYRRKANIKGFRPGKVPMGMIRKMYFKPVLIDELNRIVSDQLMGYIREEKLQILGEPMPHSGEQKEIEFDNDKEFEFKFDLGLAPEINAEITEKDKIPHYTIKVEKKVIDENVDNVAKRFGEFIKVDQAGDGELITAHLFELDKNEIRTEGGIYVEDASFSLDMIKDEKEKKVFKNKKAGDNVIFDIKKAYPNDTELSALLKIEKEQVDKIQGKFEVEIREVKAFEKHQINQELFDKVYGEGNVKSEEEFRSRIAEELRTNYERETNYKFAIDAREYFLKKTQIDLPVEFLKRWIVSSNEGMTEEKIDKEFNDYEDEFRWQLIKEKLIRTYDIQVSDEELFEYAFLLSKNQFYQYGLYNFPDEQIENYTREQLQKPEEERRLKEQKFEEKLVKFIKETVKLDKNEISEEKFRKLFEK